MDTTGEVATFGYNWQIGVATYIQQYSDTTGKSESPLVYHNIRILLAIRKQLAKPRKLVETIGKLDACGSHPGRRRRAEVPPLWAPEGSSLFEESLMTSHQNRSCIGYPPLELKRDSFTHYSTWLHWYGYNETLTAVQLADPCGGEPG